MNTPSKFAGFALGLAAIFGIAVALGAAIGPTPDSPAGHDTHPAGPVTTGGSSPDQLPGGLLVSDRGYTLQLDTPQVRPGAEVAVGFRVLDAAGLPVTRYERSHDKDLHLIVVRRDMAAFQHVHPRLDATGTWRVPLDLSRAGDYRLFADFTPAGGQNVTLGADLRVPGNYDARTLPSPADTAVVDGYTVDLDGAVIPGQASTVTLSVSRNGRPVTDLQPYLGAYGHLVALRAADLAYLHVHPEGEPGDGSTPSGPGITFSLTAPTSGDYRLFLDFQHKGTVRTAEFTVRVTQGTPGAEPPPAQVGEQPGHGH
ncbi:MULTISPECIES: hypothetical protein [Nocardia]|uniref:hypothetical protein n=1 Tax=Nocardia TaxID=1817 RepID=UPI00245908FC|nr:MULTISPECIES: hypothetical protein [Nocardia]BDT85504.1 hypothetical protein FMUAM8_12680 [Nocardia cyriacigeorgica]